MKSLVANIEDVFREAAARWTLIAYFVLSSAFILLFASAVNLDVVDGALAGAKLFGNSLDLAGGMLPIEELSMVFEASFSAMIFMVSIFLAIFATAHLVPRLQDKGTVDLYLSRPVSRSRMLLERYLAGMLLAASNIVYLIVSIWLLLGWKTGVFHARFLVSGLIILLVVAVLLAFAFLIGVVTSSTAVSIMSTFALYFMTIMLAAHDRIADALTSEFWRGVVHSAYWILPKTLDLQTGTLALIAGDKAPPELAAKLSVSPYMTTSLFGLGVLTLAVFLFRRKEF